MIVAEKNIILHSPFAMSRLLIIPWPNTEFIFAISIYSFPGVYRSFIDIRKKINTNLITELATFMQTLATLTSGRLLKQV